MSVKFPMFPGYVVDSTSGRLTKEMIALPGGPALGEILFPGAGNANISDSVDLAHPVVLECLTAGSLTYVTINGDEMTRTLAPGDRVPVFVRRVNATAFSGTYTGYVYNFANATPTDT